MSFRALNIEFYFYECWVLFSDSCGLYLIIYLASLTNQVNKSALRALEAISLYVHPASQQNLQINMDKIKFSAALEMYQELTYKKGTNLYNDESAMRLTEMVINRVVVCKIIVLFTQTSCTFS